MPLQELQSMIAANIMTKRHDQDQIKQITTKFNVSDIVYILNHTYMILASECKHGYGIGIFHDRSIDIEIQWTGQNVLLFSFTICVSMWYYSWGIKTHKEMGMGY